MMIYRSMRDCFKYSKKIVEKICKMFVFNSYILFQKRMMRNFYLVLLALIVLTSCSKKDRLLSQAKRDAKEMIEKEAMEPEYFNRNLRLEDITPVYNSDSLSILYLTIRYNNNLGMDVSQRAEFVHFGDRWFLHYPDKDKGESTIFFPYDSFDEEKSGTLYENYQYDDAIYYRAAFFMNEMNKDGRYDIPIKTGLWKLCNKKNSYNEDTGSNCLSLCSFYCVEEDRKDDVKVELVVDNTKIYFILWRKMLGSYSMASNDGNFTIELEDSEGNPYGPWLFRKTDKGIIPAKNKENITKEMWRLLEKESVITVLSRNDGFWRRSRVRFKMNFAGYNEAKRHLR